jgi:NAD(P)-dependent dehydrogenase (short-subunit alcohol dehydrogenase family)
MGISRRQFIQATAAGTVLPSLSACSTPEAVPAPGVSLSGFDHATTAEEVTEGMDLGGKLAVVTGCNSGIGFETMRVLALRGAYVIGTGRTLEKAQEACSRVRGVTTPIQLELSDFGSIVACAETIRAMNTPVDILICNAGMRGGDYGVVNGTERHFAVNHLGHFLLVNRLLDRLFLAWQGRVINVSSRVAYTSAPDEGILFDDLTMQDDWSVARAYAHSKLANALFSFELARLLKGTRITSNALHPGVINTNIVRDESALLRLGFSLLTSIRGKTVEQGAATTCYVATHPSLGNVSGEFFEDCRQVVVRGPNHTTNEDQASRLWLRSRELVGKHYVTHERPDWSDFRDGIRGDRSPDLQNGENL